MIKEVAAVCRNSKGNHTLRWVLKNKNVKGRVYAKHSLGRPLGFLG